MRTSYLALKIVFTEALLLDMFIFWFKIWRNGSLKLWSVPTLLFHVLYYLQTTSCIVPCISFSRLSRLTFCVHELLVLNLDYMNITFPVSGASDVSAEDEQEFCQCRYVVFVVTLEPLHEVLRGRCCDADQRLSKWRTKVSTSLRFGVLIFTLQSKLCDFRLRVSPPMTKKSLNGKPRKLFT